VTDLLTAMDDNLAQHASHLHRHAPGMRVLAGDDVLVCDSGLADDTFNIVAAARFATAPDDRIAATLTSLRAAGRPFTWWIGPSSTPADLSERLVALGLPVGEREVAMWSPTSRRPVSHEVHVATTPAELSGFARVVAANWSPPSPTVVDFFTRTARWSLAAESQARYIIGYDDKTPVAAAELFYGAGVAGFYSVCTLESHRRRGYASALVSFALGLAASDGYELAILQAASGGFSTYEQLGFRPCGDVVEHAFRP